MKKFIKTNPITIVLFLGLAVRAIFVLFIGELYFGREQFYHDGDTASWLECFNNLVEHGTYSVNLDSEWGYFFRMPGYSFFAGCIYHLFGMNSSLAFPVIAWFQIFLDVVSIFLIYRISSKIFSNNKTGIIASLLYALYPFIIVWTPIVYSESISVFLMLLAIWFFVHHSKKKFLLSGIFVGLAILFRPQIALLAPIMAFALIVYQKYNFKNLLSNLFLFSFGVLISYGPWPVRNYINHKKIVLTQDLRGYSNWNIDVISFMQYIYSVKSEWEPQFSSILKNKKVEFPEISYSNAEDSIKLEKAVALAKTCGSGFSNWGGYWKERIRNKNHCNEEIAALFNELRENQIKENPINFYMLVPIENLSKAFFKTQLRDQSKGIKKLASLLFYYRTFLNILALAGCFLLMRKKQKYFFLLFGFPALIYLILCFGTGVQFRNIEMRYFLHADIILLIPCAYLIERLLGKVKVLQKK